MIDDFPGNAEWVPYLTVGPIDVLLGCIGLLTVVVWEMACPHDLASCGRSFFWVFLFFSFCFSRAWELNFLMWGPHLRIHGSLDLLVRLFFHRLKIDCMNAID